MTESTKEKPHCKSLGMTKEESGGAATKAQPSITVNPKMSSKGAASEDFKTSNEEMTCQQAEPLHGVAGVQTQERR